MMQRARPVLAGHAWQHRCMFLLSAEGLRALAGHAT